MGRKWFNLFIACVLLLQIPSYKLPGYESRGEVIYVPDDYPTIEDAVVHAEPGDTIIVRNGTYAENIKIDKSLTLKSEWGPKNCIVKAKDKGDPVFLILSDHVTLRGFTVIEGGIYLYRSRYCKVVNNVCSFCPVGIGLEESSMNRVIENKCAAYNAINIGLVSSNSNLISRNILLNSTYFGIILFYSKDNIIFSNDFADNAMDAFFWNSLLNLWVMNYWKEWEDLGQN